MLPQCDAQLVVCGPLTGANAKVSKLAQLEPLATYRLLVISDADVRVPPDFLANVVAFLDPGKDAFHRVPDIISVFSFDNFSFSIDETPSHFDHHASGLALSGRALQCA